MMMQKPHIKLITPLDAHSSDFIAAIGYVCDVISSLFAGRHPIRGVNETYS